MSPRCRRCGDRFEPTELEQRHCPVCIRELAARDRQPDPRWVAPWLRRLQAKDMTDRVVGATL